MALDRLARAGRRARAGHGRRPEHGRDVAAPGARPGAARHARERGHGRAGGGLRRSGGAGLVGDGRRAPRRGARRARPRAGGRRLRDGRRARAPARPTSTALPAQHAEHRRGPGDRGPARGAQARRRARRPAARLDRGRRRHAARSTRRWAGSGATPRSSRRATAAPSRSGGTSPRATRGGPLPRLLLQPLLENAVKHGALRRREGGQVACGRRSHRRRGARDVRASSRTTARVPARGRRAPGARGPGARHAPARARVRGRRGVPPRGERGAHAVGRRSSPAGRCREAARAGGRGRVGRRATTSWSCSQASGAVEVVGAVASAEDARQVLASRPADGGSTSRSSTCSSSAASGTTRASSWSARIAGRPARRCSCSPRRSAQHAIDAFDLGVVDYLLKPFTEARVAQCLERLRGRRAATPSGAATPAADRRAAQARARVPAPRRGLGVRGGGGGSPSCTRRAGGFDVDLSLSAVEALNRPRVPERAPQLAGQPRVRQGARGRRQRDRAARGAAGGGTRRD